MKTINDDPYEFFQQGGWTFLGGTAVDEVRLSLLRALRFSSNHFRATRMTTPHQSQSSRPSQRPSLVQRAMRPNPPTMTVLTPVTMRAVGQTSMKTAMVSVNVFAAAPECTQNDYLR